MCQRAVMWERVKEKDKITVRTPGMLCRAEKPGTLFVRWIGTMSVDYGYYDTVGRMQYVGIHRVSYKEDGRMDYIGTHRVSYKKDGRIDYVGSLGRVEYKYHDPRLIDCIGIHRLDYQATHDPAAIKPQVTYQSASHATVFKPAPVIHAAPVTNISELL